MKFFKIAKKYKDTDMVRIQVKNEEGKSETVFFGPFAEAKKIHGIKHVDFSDTQIGSDSVVVFPNNWPKSYYKKHRDYNKYTQCELDKRYAD